MNGSTPNPFQPMVDAAVSGCSKIVVSLILGTMVYVVVAFAFRLALRGRPSTKVFREFSDLLARGAMGLAMLSVLSCLTATAFAQDAPSCGTRAGASMFRVEEPPPIFKQLSQHQGHDFGGGTMRSNVVMEIEIMAGSQPNRRMARIIRPISEVLPSSLAGKTASMLIGCVKLPDAGARGVIWGEIVNEGASQPVITPY